MIYPGGWNDLALSQPKPIKNIIPPIQIYDGSICRNEYDHRLIDGRPTMVQSFIIKVNKKNKVFQMTNYAWGYLGCESCTPFTDMAII